MSNITVEVPREAILKAIFSLPSQEIQVLMRELFVQKLYKPPELEKVATKGRDATKQRNLSQKIVKEAIKWARSRKS